MSARKKAAKEISPKKTLVSPRREKSKLSTSLRSDLIPTTKPRVSLNIKITSIENLTEYSKNVNCNDFKIEVSHHNFQVTPLNENSGEIYVCPCEPSEDVLSDEYFSARNFNTSQTTSAFSSAPKIDVMSLECLYSIQIDPTDIDDLNKLVDTPLLFTLYRLDEVADQLQTPRITVVDSMIENLKKKSSKKGVNKRDKREKVESSSAVETVILDKIPNMSKTPVGYAHLDLVSYVKNKPLQQLEEIYVYPITVLADLKTPKIKVQVSSAEALNQMSDESICNCITITLEDIFNPPDFLFNSEIEVLVDVSLITRQTGEGDYETKKIVTFSHGKLCKYEPNDLFKRWNKLGDVDCIGLLTQLEVNRSLRGIHNSKNIDFSVINGHFPVIRFNSISRQVLIGNACPELENLINYSDEQVVVEVRFVSSKQTEDGQAMYLGTLDLSPLLYPEVKSGRFVVPIKRFDKPEIPAIPKPEKKAQKKRSVALGVKKMEKTPSGLTRATQSIDTLPTKPTGVLRNRKEMKSQTIEKLEIELAETRYCVASMIESPLGENLFLVLEICFTIPITESRSKTICAELVKATIPEVDEVQEETHFKVLAETIEEELEQQIVKILQSLPVHINADVILSSSRTGLADNIDEVPFLKEIKENMTNTIMRLVAVKYNHNRKTSDNSHFKDLMSVVYNNLTEKIGFIINDYFSGKDNSVKLKQRARKDLHMFIAKEFHVLNYAVASRDVYKQRLEDPENYEETMLDLAIDDLANMRYEQANGRIKELLLRNNKNLYGLIIQAYIEYISNGLESLYPLLTNIVNLCPDNVEVWTLLYVLYKNKNYRAGFKHAKMMYETNCADSLVWLPFFCSRKEPYFEAQFDDCAPHNCIYIFLKLGTLKFAEMVYDLFKENIKENARIIITSTLYLLTMQYESGLRNLKTFRRNSKTDILVHLYEGHFLFALGKEEEAILEYQIVFHSGQTEVSSQIAALRCGFWDIKHKKYESAKTYFSACAQTMGTFLSWYGLGITFFRTNQLDEAESCFSKATDIYKPFAEVWIYLAMINLKLNKQNEAIVCYQKAKKYCPTTTELWDEMICIFRKMNVALPVLF